MSTTRAAPGRGALTVAVLGLILAGTLVAARTVPGQQAVTAAGAFLEYYAGVFTLVTLTGAVFFGAVAALRVLAPGPRVVFQALHRSAAVTAVGFLITHALIKVMEAHAKPLDLIIPTSPSWVALGTISGDLLILAAASGAVRGRYATTIRPWAWRTLHCTVYATWPIGLAHGLLAGRAAKPWVTISYLVCAAVIIGLLLLRSATSRHAPPGSVPLADLSSLSEPRRGEGAGPRTSSFTAESRRTESDRPRTDSFRSEPARDEPDRARHRADPDKDRPGTGPLRAARVDADEPRRPAASREDPGTGPFTAARVNAEGVGSPAASFTAEPTWTPPDPAASGTASYVPGARTNGPIPSAAPGFGPTSGPFPSAPPAPNSGPFPAAPPASTTGPFPAAPGPMPGPFPAADVPGPASGDRLVAGSYGAWPPPPPPPPASIADLIGSGTSDPGVRPQAASGAPTPPTPPTPPRIEDVIADASAGPRVSEPAGPSRTGGFPRVPADAGEPRSAFFGDRDSGPGESAGFAARSGARSRTEFSGFRAPESVRASRWDDDDSEPERRGRKGKKGKHNMSVDEQDAAFWSSLRAESRDWTRRS